MRHKLNALYDRGLKFSRSAGFINTLALMISSGTGFLSLLTWTRILTPTEFGSYALYGSFALLINAMAFEWLRISVGRLIYASKGPNNINYENLNSIVTMYLAVILAVVAAAVAVIAVMDVRGMGGGTLAILTACYAISEMGIGFIAMAARVRSKNVYFFLIMVAKSVLGFVFGLVFAAGFGMGAAGVLLGIVVAQLLVFLAGLALDPAYRLVDPRAYSRQAIRGVTALGGPIIITSALSYGSSVIDRYVIALTLGAEKVGLYAAPVDLMQKTIIFVMMSISTTTYPAIVRAFEDKGEEEAKKELEKNSVLQIGIALPFLAIFASLSPGISNLFLGSAFREYGAILIPVVAVTSILKALLNFQISVALQMIKRTKYLVIASLASGVFTTLFGYLGARFYGIEGVAFGVMLAQALTYAIGVIILKSNISIRMMSSRIIMVSFASIAIFMILIPARNHDSAVATVLLSIFAAGVYGALVLLLPRIRRRQDGIRNN